MQNDRCGECRGHILVVDHNRDALTLLESLLAWRGYQVTTAADGFGGLKEFRPGRFQLILTDFSIPVMSGWELGRIVKKSEPSVPVALLTGLDMEPRPDSSPFDAVISKPFYFHEFNCLVDSLIQTRKA